MFLRLEISSVSLEPMIFPSRSVLSFSLGARFLDSSIDYFQVVASDVCVFFCFARHFPFVIESLPSPLNPPLRIRPPGEERAGTFVVTLRAGAGRRTPCHCSFEM